MEAFNNALFLFGDEIDALRNAKWKLRGFYQRNRGDVTAALGLLHVCQMLGDREEAVQLANELWGRRASLPSHERVTLAVSHLSLGQFERAVEFAASPENTSLAFPLEERTIIIKQAWSCTWNRDLFRNYGLDELLYSPEFEDELQEAKLLDIMDQRQSLVNRIIVPRPCGRIAGSRIQALPNRFSVER